MLPRAFTCHDVGRLVPMGPVLTTASRTAAPELPVGVARDGLLRATVAVVSPKSWRKRPSTAVVVGGALVDAGAVAGDLAGAAAFEGGERAALVGCDPHVDHRDVAAGVDRAGRALAGRILDADHDFAEAPAQVLCTCHCISGPPQPTSLGSVSDIPLAANIAATSVRLSPSTR